VASTPQGRWGWSWGYALANETVANETVANETVANETVANEACRQAMLAEKIL
jgi:hypothetical protein